MQNRAPDPKSESKAYGLKAAAALMSPWIMAAVFPKIFGILAMGITYAIATTTRSSPGIGMMIGMTIPSWTAIAIALCMIAILMVMSKRIWALRLPMLLTAGIACLLLSDLTALRAVMLANFSGKWSSVLPQTDIGSLLSLASRSAWTVYGIAIGLAILRPVSDWRRNAASRTFVAIAAFAGAEAYLAMMWRMATPGVQYPASHWNAIFGPSGPFFAWLPITLGVAAMGTALWQRMSTNREATLKRKPEWPILAPIVIGTAIGMIAYLAASSPRIEKIGWSAWTLNATILKGFELGWIYIIPCITVALAISLGRKSKTTWAICIAATLAPFGMWAIERSSIERWESRSREAPQIAWQRETGDGKAILLPVENREGSKIIRERKLGKSYAKYMERGQWRYAGNASYQTNHGAKKEIFDASGDYIEVTDTKSDEVGRHVPQSYTEPGTLYVYVGEGGRRRLVGEIPYSPPFSRPEFPPMLSDDGAWQGTRPMGPTETSKEGIINRILREIPM